MAKFTYNNSKDVSINYMLFKLNFSYYLCIFFEENINLSFQSKTADELFAKL